MFTPSISKHRKNLRQSICSFFPGDEPSVIFRKICKKGTQFPYIGLNELEKFCEKASVPSGALENVFAPYGVKDIQINKNQFISFFNDDFPKTETDIPENINLTKRQVFMLSKFLGVLRIKFGNTNSQRWNSALARNPPNTINTSLRVSALCHLFYEMNLPFNVSEFVDAIFAFYGAKVEAITFKQFGDLFAAIK